MDTPSYVYMLASQRYGTLYIGVTTDLVKRVWEHRTEFFRGFTGQYGVKTLVWYEAHPDIVAAIAREKQALAAQLEDSADLRRKSVMARSLRRYLRALDGMGPRLREDDGFLCN